MREWVDAVERKARIIHEQLATARGIAERNEANVDEVTRPYLELLDSLYSDEFAFAKLVDASDLVTRFMGPAVSGIDPTVTTLTSLFNTLRNQIRGVAKSIVGLSGSENMRWPSKLDPHLSGLSQGSLVVGISIQPPDQGEGRGQLEVPGVSYEIVESVRAAVRSIATVARHVHEDHIDSTAIQSNFPDPAVRDTVMVAASKLAPSGRRGIEGVAFYGPEVTGAEAPPLTARSRKALNQSLTRPVRISGQGSFEGVVRAIDLDARRFEVREVEDIGAIRCIYESNHQESVKDILDRRVRVSGSYETMKNQKPRLIDVASIDVSDISERQTGMEF